MIPSATLDAATRVADYAARRRIALDPRLLPPRRLLAMPPKVKSDAPGVHVDSPEPPQPYPQGAPDPQRIISA